MSRSYSRVRPKIHFVYDIDNILSLYSVSRNTVTNWIREGLQPSDDQTPKLFSGYELKRFHDERRERSKTGKLRSGEFRCLGCKIAVIPDSRCIHSLNETVIHTGANLIFATCPECDGQISKVVNATEWDSVIRCIKTNTSLESIDEGNGSVPACIVNQSTFHEEKLRSKNNRILYDWLKHAGKYDQKTTNAHLLAIRDFEKICEYICFTKLKIDHAAKYRDSLIERSTMGSTRTLSRSTVSHRASYLRLFTDWLTNQKNYGRLNKSIPSYLELSRKQMAQALQPEPKAYPTVDQAVQMVKSMPVSSSIDRRNRCMVAVPFLSALRADATASLLIKHVNTAAKQIIQDASSMRTKNSKSLRINWFPVPEIFEKILKDWLDELIGLGFRPDDALFPHINDLRKLTDQEIREHPSVKPLKGSSAVTKAFQTACIVLDEDFTPHSAKHTLAALRDQICRTEIERKVFSENLGHSHERITSMYAKPTDELRKDTFDKFRSRPTIGDDDKDLMLDFHDHLLTRGTPEFERALQLVNERRTNGIN